MGKTLYHLRRRTLTQALRWKLWQYRSGRKGYVVSRIQRGVRMRLYSDDKLSELIYFRNFERSERQFLNAFLRPGDTFVDVGAHVGLFALIAARLVDSKGSVFAFEPCADTYDRLVDNVTLNQLSNVECINKAISDFSGQIEMFASQDGFSAWNSLGYPSAGRCFAKEPVDAITLDEFAIRNNLLGLITMIKIDVEGWELRVLSGAVEILSRNDAPILQVEFTDQNAQSAGSSCRQLFQALIDLGYKIFRYDEERRALVPESLRSSYPYLNLIAAKSWEVVLSRIG